MTSVIFFDLDETLAAQEKAFAGAYQAVAGLAAEAAGVDPDSFAGAIPTVAESCFAKLQVATSVRRCRFGGRDVLWGDPSGDSQTLRELNAATPAFRKAVWSTVLGQNAVTDPALCASLETRFVEEMTVRMAAFGEVTQVLAHLSSRYRLAIITNGMPAAQTAKIRRLALDQHFEAVIASAEVGVGKPAREIFQHALAVMNVRADEAMMVGDSWEGDVMGARRIGMRACWIRRYTPVLGDNTDGIPTIPDLTSLEALLESPTAGRPSFTAAR